MADNMTIEKVKISTSDDRITVNFCLVNECSTSRYIGTYTEPAMPEFYEAFKALIPVACNALDLDLEGDGKRVMVYGFTLKQSDDGQISASLQCKFAVPSMKTTAQVTTPMKKEPLFEEDNGGAFFTKEELNALRNAIDCTKDYVQGKRAQGSLFDENGEPNTESIVPVVA